MTSRVVAWGLAAGLLLPGWTWASQPADVKRADVVSLRVRTAHPRYAQSRQACGTDHAGFLVDTAIAYLPAIGSQANPDGVFGDSAYFVVWEQWHRGNVDIYGARLRSDGVLLDSGGIVICCAEKWQLRPAVAFDGLNFIVVWEDERNGQTSDIYGTRVTRAGVVLDSAGIPICTAENWQLTPSVAFDGTNYLVAWQDQRDGPSERIYCARVSPAGIVLDTANIAMPFADARQARPSTAAGSAGYLVVWQDDYNLGHIFGARVSSSGNLLDTVAINLTQYGYGHSWPFAAFDGTSYFVVWSDGSACIRGARVNQAGVLLDSVSILVSSPPPSGTTGVASVSFAGTNYLVVWDCNGSENDLYGARVTPAGEVLDSAGLTISRTPGSQWFPAVAAGPEGWFVSWSDMWPESCDVSGARVTHSGQVLDTLGIDIPHSANVQGNPSAAFNGTNYLVVWRDDREGGEASDIYGTRISVDGSVLDPAAIVVSASANWQSLPAAASDSNNYLVAWVDSRHSGPELYCGRVSAAGTVLDPDGIALQGSFDFLESPGTACDGVNYLVTWGEDSAILAARVSSTGVLLDSTPIRVSRNTASHKSPAVAFDGSNYMIVWTQFVNGLNGDIHGVRVSPSGEVLDSAAFIISDAPDWQDEPALAFDGTNHLVAWLDSRNNSTYQDVYAARITQSGALLDSGGIALSPSPSVTGRPSVAFVGDGYLVVWSEVALHYEQDLYGVRVDRSGLVTDSFPVVTEREDQQSPAVVSAGQSHVLLTYAGWAGTVSGRTYNTMRTWCALGPFPAVAEGRTRRAGRGTPYSSPTIIRGWLRLEDGPSASSSWLLDATGRKVMELRLGENDVSTHAPGVYFIHDAKEHPQAVRKVIVAE